MRLTLRPERFAAGGEAIARDDDGRVVFVRGALPGEVVDRRGDGGEEGLGPRRHRGRRRAVARAGHPAVPRRGAPGAGAAAGSTSRWRPSAGPGSTSSATPCVVRAASPIRSSHVGGGVDPSGYRTTIRVAGTADGIPGFRAEHSHEVVAAPACLVAHPALAALLPSLRLDPGVELTLRMSVATGELAAWWDTATGSVTGLPDGTLIGGRATLHEDVAGHRLRVSMGSFFQSGPQAAELLVDTVRRAAPELAGAGLVVDAYAGIGMFARCVTDEASQVIAIETSRSAVADAEHNLAGRDAAVVRGEVGGWRIAGDTDVDVVVADPARSGLGKPGVGALARIGAPVLVLVSCDPASLGRDAKLLAAAGYRHERSEVVDTFPHTTHVEAVTRFVRD